MNEGNPPKEEGWAQHQATPSASNWLRDLREVLSLAPATIGAVRVLVYERYPDSGLADEYRFCLWNAFAYLVKHRDEIEEYGWSVLEEKQSMIKNAFLIALYEPFLSCPLETMHLLQFPVEEIAARAKQLEETANRNQKQ